MKYETDAANGVVFRLGRRADCRLWRANVIKGVAVNRDGSKRRIAAGTKGQGDYIGVVTVNGIGVHLEVETKSDTGRLLPEQRARRDLMQQLGAIYISTKSEDDAERQLELAIEKIKQRMKEDYGAA